MTTIKNYPAVGLWHVTTEGDCEGKSTKDLGVHLGSLDDIAFALSTQAHYGLQFALVGPDTYNKHPMGDVVSVSLDIDSGTWDMPHERRMAYFRDMLSGRDLEVRSSTFYACVQLVRGADPKTRENLRKQALAASARAKLTAEELEVLGLEKA